MNRNAVSFLSLIFMMALLSACSMGVPEAISTPSNTETPTASPTNTPKPTRTPLPTKTPNLAATQQYEDWYAEIQQYYEKGYIGTADGNIKKISSFSEAWAQIDWYSTWLLDETAENFVFSAHYSWASSSKTPNLAGCGFVFGIQEDGSDFSVFLDKSQLLFLRSEFNTGYRVGRTRGPGTVDIDEPTEADFTLIVYDYYSYAIVNGEVIGEYTLPKSKNLEGDLGVSILSGTNKGYGTRCTMTDMRLWTPNK